MYAFVNIWFNKNLPLYFDYFLKSCNKNPKFNWFLFTNCVTSRQQLQNVFLIPYNEKELKKDCSYIQNINSNTFRLWHKNGLPCRIQILQKDIFKKYQFLGTFDLDVIYGKIQNHLPKDIHQYGMITGHSGLLWPKKIFRNCMAFTLFRRDCLQYIINYKNDEENELDESYKFTKYFKDKYEVFYYGKNLQVIGETLTPQGLNENYYEAHWDNGILTINGIESGFYHMLPIKFSEKFKIIKTKLHFDKFRVNYLGIQPIFKTFI